MSSSTVNGQAADPRAAVCETARAPVADRALAASERETIDVATNDERPGISEDVENLGGPGSGDRVTHDNDLVDRLAIEVRQDGLERGQVAVDVADRRDPHGARLSRAGARERESRPCADEVERGAVGASELARGRHELASADALDCSGQLGLELGKIVRGKRRP